MRNHDWFSVELSRCLYVWSYYICSVEQRHFNLTASVQGIQTFYGDGKGTVRGSQVTISSYPYLFKFHYDFTYSISNDGTITTNLIPGTWIGTYITGPVVGQTVTKDNFTLSGMASNDNKVLVFTTPTPQIETNTNLTTGAISPRICHRTRVLIWQGE